MKRPVIITFLVAALLFVLAGIVAVIFFTVDSGIQINNPFDIRNVPSELEESKTLKVNTDKPVTLKVADAAGGVSITGADVDSVQVKVVKTAYASSQARADEEVKGIKYAIEQTGNDITLTYELPESMNFNNKVNTVDFIVTVPVETTVGVNDNFGEVNVSNTKGDVDIKNDFGNVTIENIEGALSVQTNSGKVKATNIKAGESDINLRSDFGEVNLIRADGANIALHSNSGTINLNNVHATGELVTKTDFGETKYEDGSANSLYIKSNSGSVSILNVTVTTGLKVEDGFGEIELSQTFADSYDLRTNSGAITINGAKNKLKAYTDFGNIVIEDAQSATLDLQTNSGAVRFSGSLGKGPHTVKSDFGGIRLTLPANSKLDVDLKTDQGNISSDIPLTVRLDGSSDKNRQTGTMNGGGDQLTVMTNSGTINIETLNK